MRTPGSVWASTGGARQAAWARQAHRAFERRNRRAWPSVLL